MDLFLENSNGDYKFGCLMWNTPKFYADLIMSWGKVNIPDKVLYIDPKDPALGRENEIHLTLKYGFHTSDPAAVQAVIKDFGHFLVEFGEISKFEKKDKYDVIKITVDGKKLRRLNALVSSELKCTDSYPEYNPHITLAYVLPGSCDHLLGKYIFRDVSIKATELVFSTANENNDKVTINLK